MARFALLIAALRRMRTVSLRGLPARPDDRSPLRRGFFAHFAGRRGAPGPEKERHAPEAHQKRRDGIFPAFWEHSKRPGVPAKANTAREGAIKRGIAQAIRTAFRFFDTYHCIAVATSLL